MQCFLAAVQVGALSVSQPPTPVAWGAANDGVIFCPKVPSVHPDKASSTHIFVLTKTTYFELLQCVQITRSNYDLIKDAFDCAALGLLDVKGTCPTEVSFARLASRSSSDINQHRDARNESPQLLFPRGAQFWPYRSPGGVLAWTRTAYPAQPECRWQN